MFILVGYASVHGSTREIAERIAAKLRDRKHRVDVLPVDEVRDTGIYQAAVIGSAIHDQVWLAHALKFVEDNATTFATRPVWLFSVGMADALGRRLQAISLQEGARAAASLKDTLRPRGHRLFSGVIQPQHFSLSGRLAFKLMGGRYGDFRNWKDIEGWAKEIDRELSKK